MISYILLLEEAEILIIPQYPLEKQTGNEKKRGKRNLMIFHSRQFIGGKEIRELTGLISSAKAAFAGAASADSKLVYADLFVSLTVCPH